MSMRDGIGWACLNAIAAEDATRVVDVVNARVALPRGDTLRVGIFRSLDVDAACRTGRRAQEAAHALFQPVFVSMQNVNPAVPSLEVDRLFRIIFSDGFPQHVAEGHAETLHQGDECFAGFFYHRGHRFSVEQSAGCAANQWDSGVHRNRLCANHERYEGIWPPVNAATICLP